MLSFAKIFRLASLSAAVVFPVAASHSAVADAFTVSYLGAGIQASSNSTAVESFDSVTATNSTLTTNFNGSGVTGTYTGSFSLSSPNVYGGANGTGKFITTASSYTLTLSQNVNYFGLWFSALDAGNELAFFNGADMVFSFSPTDYATLVGACPTSTPAPNFCGNPNAAYAGNTGQQYAFLNFYDGAGSFNKVMFTEDPQVGGGFETDNHTLGQLSSTPGGTVISPVPEPSGLALLGSGAMGFAGLVRRRIRRG